MEVEISKTRKGAGFHWNGTEERETLMSRQTQHSLGAVRKRIQVCRNLQMIKQDMVHLDQRIFVHVLNVILERNTNGCRKKSRS